MNRQERRKAVKIARRNKNSSCGAFGSPMAVRAWREKKLKMKKTFSRYLKEGKDSFLKRKRKAWLSALDS